MNTSEEVSMERVLAKWPTVVASGISVPNDVTRPEAGGNLSSLTLSIDEQSSSRGRDIMQMVRDLIRQYPKEGAVRELGRMVREFGEIVPHMPEIAEFIDRLGAEGAWAAAARVVGDSTRGRPYTSPFYLVGLVDRVCEQFEWPVCRAAVWLAENYQSQLCKGARAIENDYSRFKDIYDRKFGCRFVAPGRLLATRVSIPGR